MLQIGLAAGFPQQLEGTKRALHRPLETRLFSSSPQPRTTRSCVTGLRGAAVARQERGSASGRWGAACLEAEQFEISTHVLAGVGEGMRGRQRA
jgi:hypothetical protein